MESFLLFTGSRVKFALLIAFLTISAGAFAQTATLSVQGVLTKSDGTAVDDGNDYALTFRLWKNDSSTNPSDKAYEETISGITIVGGVYSVVLGEDINHPLTAPFNQPYWLGVSIGSSSVELLPRPRLTHAPYALGLVGQNNTFPSTGSVVADAYRAEGGPAVGGPNGNGFSFKPSGDQGGGMFSNGSNNIEFWAGGQKRVLLNNSQNEIYGQTVNFGPMVTNDFTVNGNALINNVGNNTGNLTVKNFLSVEGAATVNSVLTTHNNLFVDAHSNIGGNQTVNGVSLTKQFNRTYGAADGGGFTFYYPNVIDDTDSGLFGGGDGYVQIRCNGLLAAQFGPPVGYTNQCCEPQKPGSSVRFFGIQKGPDNPQVEWDEVSGQLQVDNSSRRLKRNIEPMWDNYRQILKAQPKLYNRIGYPDSLVELGFIAEEFDSLGLKRLVHYNSKNEIIGINYKKVPLYLLEVVKDHDAEIEKMQEEIAALKLANQILVKENSNLKNTTKTLLSQQDASNRQLQELSKRMDKLERKERRRK